MPLSGRVSLEGFVPGGFSSPLCRRKRERTCQRRRRESCGDTWPAVLGGLRWLASPHRHRGASLLRRPAGHLRLRGATPASAATARAFSRRQQSGSPALEIKFALENSAEHFNQVLARLWLTSSLNMPSRILTAGTKAPLASPGSTAMSAIATPAACEITATAKPVIVSAIGRTTTGDNGGGQQDRPGQERDGDGDGTERVQGRVRRADRRAARRGRPRQLQAQRVHADRRADSGRHRLGAHRQDGGHEGDGALDGLAPQRTRSPPVTGSALSPLPGRRRRQVTADRYSQHDHPAAGEHGRAASPPGSLCSQAGARTCSNGTKAAPIRRLRASGRMPGTSVRRGDGASRCMNTCPHRTDTARSCRGQCMCHGGAKNYLAGEAWHDWSAGAQPGRWEP